MFIDYNKFTILLYFITGVTLTLSAERYIYGSMIIVLSASILMQRHFLNESMLYKYSELSSFVPFSVYILVILSSLLVIDKSNLLLSRKLFSVTFLGLSIAYSLAKHIFKDDEVMKKQISRYIPSILFMIFIWSVGFSPDNQAILRQKYDKVRGKVYNF